MKKMDTPPQSRIGRIPFGGLQHIYDVLVALRHSKDETGMPCDTAKAFLIVLIGELRCP